MARWPWVVLALLGATGCAEDVDDRPARWSYIASAILRPNCATSSCHSARAASGDVELEDPEVAYESLLGEDAEGDFVVPGHPQESKLLRMLRADEVDRMPPDQPLPDADIELIERWILAGARND
jgi:hypothetical protein